MAKRQSVLSTSKAKFGEESQFKTTQDSRNPHQQFYLTQNSFSKAFRQNSLESKDDINMTLDSNTIFNNKSPSIFTSKNGEQRSNKKKPTKKSGIPVVAQHFKTMHGVPFKGKQKTKKNYMSPDSSNNTSQVPNNKNNFHKRNISWDNRDLNTCSASTFDPLLEKVSPQILSMKLKEAHSINLKLPNVPAAPKKYWEKRATSITVSPNKSFSINASNQSSSKLTSKRKKYAMQEENEADTDIKHFLGFTMQAFKFKPERKGAFNKISHLIPQSQETDRGLSIDEPAMMSKTLNENLFPKTSRNLSIQKQDDATISKEFFDQNFKLFKKFKDYQKSPIKPRTVTASPSNDKKIAIEFMLKSGLQSPVKNLPVITDGDAAERLESQKNMVAQIQEHQEYFRKQIHLQKIMNKYDPRKFSLDESFSELSVSQPPMQRRTPTSPQAAESSKKKASQMSQMTKNIYLNQQSSTMIGQLSPTQASKSQIRNIKGQYSPMQTPKSPIKSLKGQLSSMQTPKSPIKRENVGNLSNISQKDMIAEDDDQSEFNEEKFLRNIKTKVDELIQYEEIGRHQTIESYDLSSFPNYLAYQIKMSKEDLDDQEKECTDSLWKRAKMKKLQNRQLLRDVIEKMKDKPKYDKEFIQSLLIPETLKDKVINDENNFIRRVRIEQAETKPVQKEGQQQPPQLRKKTVLYGKKMTKVMISSEESSLDLQESDLESIAQSDVKTQNGPAVRIENIKDNQSSKQENSQKKKSTSRSRENSKQKTQPFHNKQPSDLRSKPDPSRESSSKKWYQPGRQTNKGHIQDFGITTNLDAKMNDSLIEQLMTRHDRSLFMLNDIKDVNASKTELLRNEMSREFAKQCYKNHTFPISSFVIQNLFRDDLYLIINKAINQDQSAALAESFQHSQKDVKEICFSNNQLIDKQCAQLLLAFIQDERLFNNLQKINLNQNEIGSHTLNALQNALIDKNPLFPIQLLSLVGLKLRAPHIDQLLDTINTRENYLQTLNIPKLKIGEEGHQALCSFIKQRSYLRTLDISWNGMTSAQVKLLFRALALNRKIEDLNLAMTSVNEGMNIKKLKQFIKENERLIHLDLSGVFKTADHVKQIIKAIKRSETLLAVHLSHTQVIQNDERLQSYIRTKLGMQQMLPKPTCSHKLKTQLKRIVNFNETMRGKFNTDVAQEEQAASLLRAQQLSETSPGDVLVLQRTFNLCHSSGNNQWIPSTECYICQKWQATCFLYNPEEEKNENLASVEHYLTGTFDSLLMRHGNQVYSSFKMQEFSQFCNSYGYSYISNQMRQTFTFVPSDALESDENDSIQWKMFADFVKPQQRPELVSIKQNDKTIFHHAFVARARTEEIIVKKNPYTVNKSKQVKVFDRKTSIFSKWQEDTVDVLAAAFKIDMKYLKVRKICHSEEEYKELQEFILLNYTQLKEIFTNLISADNYPNVGMLQFSHFCKESEIYDKNCKISDVDRFFLGVNFEPEDLPENPDRALNRYEFIEILVRIANLKFKEQGKADSLKIALQMLLNEDISKNYKVEPWQDFRSEQIWCDEVNSVFVTNLAAIDKIHKTLTTKADKKAKKVIKQFIDLVTVKVPLLSVSDAYHCYGMSQSTVINEMAKDALYQYNMLTNVEYYEFLARIAAVKYKDSLSEDLATKIERVLDLLLPYFGFQRIKIEVEDQETFSSDDSVDYEEVPKGLLIRCDINEKIDLNQIQTGLQPVASEGSVSFNSSEAARSGLLHQESSDNEGSVRTSNLTIME